MVTGNLRQTVTRYRTIYETACSQAVSEVSLPINSGSRAVSASPMVVASLVSAVYLFPVTNDVVPNRVHRP
jgi:hypothetical protein